MTDLEGLEQPRPRWFEDALAVPRAEHYVEVDGARIHGFSWGDPGKPGVLLTHGMMAHARCWAFVAPLLAQRYHLAAFDVSGMGDSSWRKNHSDADRAAEALAFAAALGMDRPALVGHSFGGSVALAAVDARPAAWRSLIICDMTMLRPEDVDEFEKLRIRRPPGDAPRTNRHYPDLATAMSRYRLAPEQPCANRFLLEYMAYHSLKTVDGGWLWKFDPGVLRVDSTRDSNWWLNLAPRFAQLQLPKALVHGEDSLMFRPHTSAFLRSLCGPRLPIVPVPGAHHHVMLDQPIALAATLDALLQGLG